MIETTVKCDICKNPKGSTNNWLLIFTGGNQIRIIRTYTRSQWSSPSAKHICGQGCLHSYVDAFVSQQEPSA